MSVQFLGCELSKWEEAGGDALVLTFFRDERPLRGAAGLVDWRLCGRLSRLIKLGRIRGEAGESLLMPPGRRLPFSRIILFGLGAAGPFDEQVFRGHVRRIRDVVRRAGVREYAVQPPGRATGLVAPRRALEMWIEESGDGLDEERVAIIDTPGAQKEMADILHTRQRASEKQAQAQAIAAPDPVSGATRPAAKKAPEAASPVAKKAPEAASPARPGRREKPR
ncbi:MAG TPA: M17 family peptidase N-terminal domain-containing protein [Kofleriaceae bacterium]|nr:M17 family peptidase N-terminal domain-containing protein [Kofleriaceae bacterium]